MAKYAEHTVWDSRPDYEDWRADMEAEYPDMTEDERYGRMLEINGYYLDDERANLNVPMGMPILLIADIGRWDGRYSGYGVIRSGNIRDCLRSDMDDCRWYVDELRDLRCRAAHHDGVNHYLYRVFKDGVTTEQMDNLLYKIYCGTATRRDMANDLEDNPPYHSNRYVLDALSEDNGALVYNGTHIRTISSIDLNGQYNGFDSYRINFTDGTQEYFNVLHPSANPISSIMFYDGGQSCPEGCEVHYGNGEKKYADVSGLDLSVAFGKYSDMELHPARSFGDQRIYLKIGSACPTEGGYSQFIDISDSDRDTAKLDYLDMVLGAGFETENLYERVYRNYNAGLWTNYHVRKAVEHGWINETDYENLTGEPYATDEEENTDDQD